MNRGRFFEDYELGMKIYHATPRTLHNGDKAVYQSLYPCRASIFSSDEVARSIGLPESPLDNLIVFHTVFGKTVPDISLNAIANLAYFEGRFFVPVYKEDTISAVSEIIGLKENSSKKSGIVYVRSAGYNQSNEKVLEYCRSVMVKKFDEMAHSPGTSIPSLNSVVHPQNLSFNKSICFKNYSYIASGGTNKLMDYDVGQIIDHIDAVTLDESEHMMATRLWQNTSKVHFDATIREDGRRLIYGGHIISMARALCFNGLENVQIILAVNSGSHVSPCFAGDTIFCWSEILDRVETGKKGIGALRLRLVASKVGGKVGELRDKNGKYNSNIVLDFDYWALIPS